MFSESSPPKRKILFHAHLRPAIYLSTILTNPPKELFENISKNITDEKPSEIAIGTPISIRPITMVKRTNTSIGLVLAVQVAHIVDGIFGLVADNQAGGICTGGEMPHVTPFSQQSHVKTLAHTMVASLLEF